MEAQNKIIINQPPPDNLIVIASLYPLNLGAQAQVKTMDGRYVQDVNIIEVVDAPVSFLPGVLTMLSMGLSVIEFRDRMEIKKAERIYFLLCKKQ